jgi:hypothetical protein
MPKVMVRSIPERFRREGMEFSREEREVEIEEETAGRLREEPMLIVREAAGDSPARPRGARKEK